MKDITVKLYPAGETLHVLPGTALRRLVDAGTINLNMPCGGKGTCGKCKVIFEEGAPDVTPTERSALTDSEIEQGCRLGCITVLQQDAVVRIPYESQAPNILASGLAREVPLNPNITKKHFCVPAPTTDDLRSDLKRIFDVLGVTGNHADLDISVLQGLGKSLRESNFDMTSILAGGKPIAFEPGDTAAYCYGIAVDLGTTTLAAYLVDLTRGEQRTVAAAINPQTRVGDDVISRIAYCSREGGLQSLQSSVVEEINKLVDSLCVSAEISSEFVYEMTLVGNTCMTHILLGVDPTNLAQAPYVSTINQSVSVNAVRLGVNINPAGVVYVLPSIAGFVGADTVGVILATEMHESDQITLAVDIGTNGEIVLGSKQRMVACSTAAGPAFEGAHIKHGMRAASGAIDSVWLEEDGLRFSTVGGEKAAGICGSGLLDAIMCLVKAQIIDSSGRIVDPGQVPDAFAHLRERVRAGERGNEFVLASEYESSTGESVVIVQRDVREVQLAKAAISAGIQTLMGRLGVCAKDLDRVVLAGAFGNYIRKETAIASGLLPDVPVNRVQSVGNAAGEGAKLALISQEARRDMEYVAAAVEYVELTTDLGFQDRFTDALVFGSGI